MALIDFGTGTEGNGDTLYAAFVKINGIIGSGAGTATYSLFVGSGLSGNTTGISDTAIGYFALQNNTTGGSNTAVGTAASQLNTTGNYNTTVGNGAGASSTSASSITSVGTFSLQNNTASNNTAVGYSALNSNTTFSNISALGANTSVSASNQVQLGDSLTTTYVYGTVQNRSDLRDKAEVRDTVLGLDFINELRPVDYKWDLRDDYKSEAPFQLNENSTEEEIDTYNSWLESVKLNNLTHDGTHTRSRFHHGLVAQEVKDVIEASGIDFGGFQDHNVSGGQDVLSIGYDELIAPMIKAIQELTARINVLEGN